ncbi:hypothetical protein ACFZBU_35555 [Embleya sp. NPDC008237]|uniref:hypothetical protein n=1 Tax=Embleya sp. NPDC008237 TaxID=3363978 RepID=UPI0036E7E8C5
MAKNRARRRALLAVAAAGIGASTLAVAPGVASATPGGYCGTYKAGLSSQPTNVKTVFTKQPPGCNDFNLTWVDHSASYGAAYWDSWGNPHMSNTRAQWHNANSNWCQPIMTNVSTGTNMIVISGDGGAGYNVHVNL